MEDRANPRGAVSQAGDDRRLPIAAGESLEDLEGLSQALSDAGIEFEIEERLADAFLPEGTPGAGPESWRILIRPVDLGSARRVIELFVRRSRAQPRGEPSRSAGPRAPTEAHSPRPLYEPGRLEILRPLTVLILLGLAGLLLLGR
ncbi:MAG: hypothetical protein ACE5IL_00270 [Myxococcota bacterium]